MNLLQKNCIMSLETEFWYEVHMTMLCFSGLVFSEKKKGLKLSIPLASQYKSSLRLGKPCQFSIKSCHLSCYMCFDDICYMIMKVKSHLKPSSDQDDPTPSGGSKNLFVRLASDAATWNKKDKIAYDNWIKFESTIRKLSAEEEDYFVSDMLYSV